VHKVAVVHQEMAVLKVRKEMLDKQDPEALRELVVIQ